MNGSSWVRSASNITTELSEMSSWPFLPQAFKNHYTDHDEAVHQFACCTDRLICSHFHQGQT